MLLRRSGRALAALLAIALLTLPTAGPIICDLAAGNAADVHHTEGPHGGTSHERPGKAPCHDAFGCDLVNMTVSFAAHVPVFTPQPSAQDVPLADRPASSWRIPAIPPPRI